MSLPAVVLSALSAAPAGVVAVAGSRQLPAGAAAVVAGVAAALAGAGLAVSVGCCVGADAAVLSAVPASALRVFAAFGPVSPPWVAARYSAPGACSLSAVAEVARALLAGASVSWWAGGGAFVPLAARLAARSGAVVAAASVGAVVFLSGPPGPRSGSWLVARAAAARSLPLVVVPLGFAGSALPLLAPGGGWRSLGAGAWLWCPPLALF